MPHLRGPNGPIPPRDGFDIPPLRRGAPQRAAPVRGARTVPVTATPAGSSPFGPRDGAVARSEADVALHAKVSITGVLLEPKAESLRIKVRAGPEIYLSWEQALSVAHEIEWMAANATRARS
ncbi:MAG: hypothetical protein ACYDDF_06535 [Thermoplasmatota archaeon]